jgi:hypothetical protein
MAEDPEAFKALPVNGAQLEDVQRAACRFGLDGLLWRSLAMAEEWVLLCAFSFGASVMFGLISTYKG